MLNIIMVKDKISISNDNGKINY